MWKGLLANIAIALTTPESARHWAVGRQTGSWELRPDCCSVSENWRRVGAVRKVEFKLLQLLRGSKSGKVRIEGRLFDGSRNDPFCTVLLEQASESIRVPKGQFARHPYTDTV